MSTLACAKLSGPSIRTNAKGRQCSTTLRMQLHIVPSSDLGTLRAGLFTDSGFDLGILLHYAKKDRRDVDRYFLLVNVYRGSGQILWLHAPTRQRNRETIVVE